MDVTVGCLDGSGGTGASTGAACANADFEDALEEASAWLEGLGFRGPASEYRAGAGVYVAYISDVDNEDEDGKRDSVGVYYTDDAQLYLTSDRYFAIGEGDTPEKRAGDLADDIPGTVTVIHELFHAVQYAYYQEIGRAHV